MLEVVRESNHHWILLARGLSLSLQPFAHVRAIQPHWWECGRVTLLWSSLAGAVIDADSHLSLNKSALYLFTFEYFYFALPRVHRLTSRLILLKRSDSVCFTLGLFFSITPPCCSSESIHRLNCASIVLRYSNLCCCCISCSCITFSEPCNSQRHFRVHLTFKKLCLFLSFLTQRVVVVLAT